jgi:hypothetical protein
MGNCLVIQDDGRKEVKITSVDGSNKVLPRSLKVQESSPLGTDGNFSLLSVKAPAAAAVNGPGHGVRVKLVVSKQELKKILDEEGTSSLEDMVSLARNNEASYGESDEQECCGGWRPVLGRIPEGQ